MFNFQFNLSTLILVIFGVINIPLSIIILKNNPKSWTNRLFALLIVLLTIYLVVNTELYVISDYNLRLIIGRAIMANAAFLNLVVFLFLSVFPKEEFTVSKKVSIPSFIITTVLFFVAFTDLIFKSISVTSENTVVPEPGLLMPIFGLHTLILILGGVIAVIKKRSKVNGIDKARVNYILFAFALLFFLILVFNFLLPVVFKFGGFVPLLPIYILLFLGIVSYTIVKHSLFGLRVVATQAFAIIIWLILLSNLFTETDNSQRIIDGLVLIFSIISGLLLVRSVVQEVKQKEQLEVLTQKLRDLDQQKNEFISMAAHELRAPMTAIKGYISMILEGDTGDIPEKARGFLADATSINDRMVRLVNNMLNVSRIEEGRMSFQFDNDELSRVIRTVYSQFLPEAQRKNLDYKLEIPNQLKDKVYADVDKLHEIAGNLISNAIKYTEKGYVCVRLSQPTPTVIRFEVEDSGPGISPEEQVKLFQKFYRVESNVGKTTGTGLGLYISRLMIEKFKGKIGLISETGKGSTFWFELPVVSG